MVLWHAFVLLLGKNAKYSVWTLSQCVCVGVCCFLIRYRLTENVCGQKTDLEVFAAASPLGGWIGLTSSSCLESQGCCSIPQLSFSPALLFFLSWHYSKWSILVTFSLQKFLQYFWLRDVFLSRTGAARGWWMACTAFCHVTLIFAIMHFCFKIKLLLLLSFLFYIL